MSLNFLRTVALLILSANLIAVPSAQQSSKKTKAQNLTRKLTTVQTKKKAVKKQLHTVKVAVWGVAADVENLDAKITTVEDLRALYSLPQERAVKKQTPALDEHCPQRPPRLAGEHHRHGPVRSALSGLRVR